MKKFKIIIEELYRQVVIELKRFFSEGKKSERRLLEMSRLRTSLVMMLIVLTGLAIGIGLTPDFALKVAVWLVVGCMWISAMTILILSSSFLKETIDGRLVLNKSHWFGWVLLKWGPSISRKTTSLCSIYWSVVMLAVTTSLSLTLIGAILFIIGKEVYFQGPIILVQIGLMVPAAVVVFIWLVAIADAIKVILQTTPFSSALAKMKQNTCPLIYIDDKSAEENEEKR